MKRAWLFPIGSNVTEARAILPYMTKYDQDGLVAVTTYRKGAKAVKDRLEAQNRRLEELQARFNEVATARAILSPVETPPASSQNGGPSPMERGHRRSQIFSLLFCPPLEYSALCRLSLKLLNFCAARKSVARQRRNGRRSWILSPPIQRQAVKSKGQGEPVRSASLVLAEEKAAAIASLPSTVVWIFRSFC